MTTFKFKARKVGTEFRPDADGGESVETTVFEVAVAADELGRLQGLYDPQVTASPVAADARPLTRCVLDADRE